MCTTMASGDRCLGSMSPFCLGMAEFNCCSTAEKKMSEEPEKKRMKLSLKRKPLSPSSRFNETVTEDMIEQSSKGIIPKGTAKATSWAIRTFSDWITQRNKRNSEVFPSDLFDKPYPIDTTISCLQRFVSEARRVDGTSYPPKTLYQILCGLLRHSREHQSDPPNFLDRKDVRFKKLHGTCDSVFHALREQGVGADKKSAKIVTKVDEDKLWESGVLNCTSADGLQKAVFFYVGKVCCLRGGEEQRNLKPSQFSRLKNPDRYVYTEHGSKNRNGGFFQLHVDNKIVEIHENKDAGEQCLVYLLDLYLSKIPQRAKDKDIFYCKPLQKYTCESDVWYSEQPRGKHFLNDMVKSMCTEAKLQGGYTNHSLRASGATELFRHHAPEHVIQQFTGHRSVTALRQYEKVAVEQQKAACNILTGASSNDFNAEVQKMNDPQKSDEKTSVIRLPTASKPVQSSISTKEITSMPPISPIINGSSGTINFTVNICPSGPTYISWTHCNC